MKRTPPIYPSRLLSPARRRGVAYAAKLRRQELILELVRKRRIPNQSALRDALAEEGIVVAQPTVSRDVRDLGLAKVPTADGSARYAPGGGETQDPPPPPLATLAPTLVGSVDGVGHLMVVHTADGAAEAVAAALDEENRPEVVGTLAGDDTVLVVVRTPGARRELARRVEELAEG